MRNGSGMGSGALALFVAGTISSIISKVLYQLQVRRAGAGVCACCRSA